MPLIIGNENAESGMTKVVYEAIDDVLGDPMEARLPEDMPEDEKEKIMGEIRDGWRDLSYAIAIAVVTYLRRDEPPSEPGENEHGESYTSAIEDAEFWDWLSAFADVFKQWSAMPVADVQELKDALAIHFDASSVPAELKGIIK